MKKEKMNVERPSDLAHGYNCLAAYNRCLISAMLERDFEKRWQALLKCTDKYTACMNPLMDPRVERTVAKASEKAKKKA